MQNNEQNEKQPERAKQEHQLLYQWVKNFTDRNLTSGKHALLSKGLEHNMDTAWGK
jgi:hypothetical protein